MRDCDIRKNTKLTWTKVRHILRSLDRNRNTNVVGITTKILNDHYAAISTDQSYAAPRAKLTATHDSNCMLSEAAVFYKLDHLKPTATGLDGIPAWFLRVGAPAFAAPLATLLNQSVSTGVVPQQWKAATITPVPKTAKPARCSDYRPISVTSVMPRLTERHIVRTYIYPALQLPPPTLFF